MLRCAILSFRLGLPDGVSVVAANWQRALTSLGFETVTVAGEGPVDRLVPGLAIDAPAPPTSDELAATLADVDLVVVENLCSIPLNLPASRAVAEVLAGRPAILHHHDPPWQRERFAHVTELPPDDPAWRHVTINELTRREMADRGLTATTIYNGFDIVGDQGDRRGTREALGVAPDDLLLVHPVRAIARKNIPVALDIAGQLGAVYWLTGQVEEGYDDELADLLANAPCPVRHVGADRRADIYAAADLVLFPSLWEGFGNPPIEAAIHRRPVVVGRYPVAAELRALGFRWLDPDDRAGIRAWLTNPVERDLEINRELAEHHLSFESMTRRLESLIVEAGWLP